MPEEKDVCQECFGTGFYGDNGPGIEDNDEFVRCDCGTAEKCRTGYHMYKVISGIAWCSRCKREADMTVCRIHYPKVEKKYRIVVDCNAGEYYNWSEITARTVKQTSDRHLLVNGEVVIEFDEPILGIEETEI